MESRLRRCLSLRQSRAEVAGESHLLSSQHRHRLHHSNCQPRASPQFGSEHLTFSLISRQADIPVREFCLRGLWPALETWPAGRLLKRLLVLRRFILQLGVLNVCCCIHSKHIFLVVCLLCKTASAGGFTQSYSADSMHRACPFICGVLHELTLTML